MIRPSDIPTRMLAPSTCAMSPALPWPINKNSAVASLRTGHARPKSQRRRKGAARPAPGRCDHRFQPAGSRPAGFPSLGTTTPAPSKRCVEGSQVERCSMGLAAADMSNAASGSTSGSSPPSLLMINVARAAPASASRAKRDVAVVLRAAGEQAREARTHYRTTGPDRREYGQAAAVILAVETPTEAATRLLSLAMTKTSARNALTGT